MAEFKLNILASLGRQVALAGAAGREFAELRRAPVQASGNLLDKLMIVSVFVGVIN